MTPSRTTYKNWRLLLRRREIEKRIEESVCVPLIALGIFLALFISAPLLWLINKWFYYWFN